MNWKKKSKNGEGEFFYELRSEKNLRIGKDNALKKNQRYLYLNELWYSKAWINGGKIPLSLASTYKSKERGGVKTPDENLIHESNIDIGPIFPLLSFFGLGDGMKNFTFKNVSIQGIDIPHISNASYYKEDGIVLCLSKVRDKKVAEKFGNKKCCLKILNVDILKNIIDAQIGVFGKIKDCTYTKDFQRNHFLKSVKDSWQCETRIFWPAEKGIEIILPPGVAEMVEEYHY